MRLMVLDAVELCGKLFGIGIKGGRQRLRNTREFRENLDAFPRERRHAQRVKKFCAQPRVRVSRHGNVIDVREREARFLQAITNRLRGKSRRVLHAVEAFFLDCGDEPAVADDRRRSVPVVRIDPKYIHLAICQCTLLEDYAARCRRHHSFRTYKDQGRDQVVFPARKSVQTERTPPGRR